MTHDHVACVPRDLPGVIGLVIWLLTYSMPSHCPSLSTAWRILVIGVLIVILLLLQFAGAIDSSLPRLAR